MEEPEVETKDPTSRPHAKLLFGFWDEKYFSCSELTKQIYNSPVFDYKPLPLQIENPTKIRRQKENSC
jgi:hypothetical protein